MSVEKIRETDYTAENNFDITRDGDQLSINLTYPNVGNDGRVKHVLVNQESVRASDGIRMHYDYDRDGWVIEQASRFAWDVGDDECDPDYQEVAFIQSWAREEAPEQQEARLAGGGTK